MKVIVPATSGIGGIEGRLSCEHLLTKPNPGDPKL